MPESRKQFAAGHRLPESVAHAIAAEAVRQTGGDAERARFIRWATKGYRWSQDRPFTAIAKRGYEYGRKLRSDHEFVHRHGPGPLDRLADFSREMIREIGRADGLPSGLA